jgi:tRNA wybutosine-synthesizing protein 1
MFFVPTYEDDQPPESASWFCKWIKDAAQDFRVSKQLLSGFQFGVFGLGDASYGEERFCSVAKWLSSSLEDLGASRVVATGFRDASKGDASEPDYSKWKSAALKRLFRPEDEVEKKKGCGCGHEGGEKSSCESSDEENEVQDLEDLGNIMSRLKKAKTANGVANGVKEMITPVLREALTKQGYKLIGSHSGVKLCRWTKVRTLQTFYLFLSLLNFDQYPLFLNLSIAFSFPILKIVSFS